MSSKIIIAAVITLITSLVVFYFYKNTSKLKKILKLIANKNLIAPAEVILLIASAYFLFGKKGLSFSLTDELKKHLPDPWVYSFIYFLYAIILIAIIVKAVSLVCEKLKILEKEHISPDGLKQICLKLNEEIEQHIRNFPKKTKPESLKELCSHHHFEQNITLIVVNLIEHLAESLKIEKKKKDLFLSIYYVENFENGISLVDYDQTTGKFNEPCENKVSKLKYLTHWDPSTTQRYSRSIDIAGKNYEQYECVKAYKEGKYHHALVNTKTYYSAHNPRAKTTKDFLCFFVEIEDIVVGLVNIEFHNNNVFDSEEDMIQYIETDLLPFKYMIQYQFLKKRFLTLLASKE